MPPTDNPKNTKSHRKIAMLVYPEANSIDISGPLQVFDTANRLYKERFQSATDIYTTAIIGLSNAPIDISAGLTLLPSSNIDQFYEDIDTLLIAGGQGPIRSRMMNLYYYGCVKWLYASGALLRCARALLSWLPPDYCMTAGQRHTGVTVNSWLNVILRLKWNQTQFLFAIAIYTHLPA